MESKNTSRSFIVGLSADQWHHINTDFSGMQSEVEFITSEDSAGLVYRLGLIYFSGFHDNFSP